jgi:hypothetical protein
VRSVTVAHAAMTAEETEVHVVTTEVQEALVVTATRLQLLSRTTSRRCSKTSLTYR